LVAGIAQSTDASIDDLAAKRDALLTAVVAATHPHRSTPSASCLTCTPDGANRTHGSSGSAASSRTAALPGGR
jgi:hypothetical protein